MPIRFETFAYLPPLSPQQIEAQIAGLLAQNCLVALEYHDTPSTADFYWERWPLPAAKVDAASGRALISPGLITAQIEACARRHPYAYIAVAGYHPASRHTVLKFIAKAPQEGQ
jgi:ribulose-bisphosphate carboxylase small chain